MATTVEFDPAALGLDGDPYPVLARLREAAPVAVIGGGLVAVSGHAPASDALRHPACISSPIATGYLEGLPDGAARDEMGHRINFLDPPDHPRVRGLVNRAFTPRRVEALRAHTEATANRLLDGIDGHDRVDLLRSFAHHLPSLVISELLGVPTEDRDRLTELSDRVAPLLGFGLTPDQRDAALAAAEEMHAYLGALLDDRRVAPRDDLLSALLAADDAGATLSSPELLSLAATLYSAGHRTTRDLFTNGVFSLLVKPDRWRAVADGRWGIADVVAEMLRYETPTLLVARVTSGPAVLGGVEVPASTPVLIYLAAANRDPAAYDAPDEFRPGRTGPPTLSFAFGAHFCLGAALARSEAEIMLAAVVERWPRLALAEPEAPAPWHQRGPFRGLDRLVVLPG